MTPPEGDSAQFNLWPQWVLQANWNSPVTSKLLLEGGISYTANRWPYPSPGDEKRGFAAASKQDISITDSTTGFVYNAKPYYTNQEDEPAAAQRFIMSYVTGSHTLKTGIQLQQLRETSPRPNSPQQDIRYTFLGVVPNRVTQFAPALATDKVFDWGFFVQDRWTVERLTLNYGVRFEGLKGSVPAQHAPAGRFVPARDFAAVDNIPNWTDLNPRLGVSYDLFGNGRTALRASVGRYTETAGTGMPGINNPIRTSVVSASRTWNDSFYGPGDPRTGNYSPDCDLLNFSTNGECGPISDQNFGQNNPNATRVADSVLSGFNKARGGLWDVSTEVQHELLPGVSLTGGWYRNWAFNFRVIDNQAVTPADYSPYCIAAPVDSRLPGGGGYQVCGFTTSHRPSLAELTNLVTNASNYYGNDAHVTCVQNAGLANIACGKSDFFGLKVSTRFRRGIQLGGGVDGGRTVNDNCFVVDSPQQLLNCREVIPFKAQTQVKIFGSYPLPAGLSVSGTLQNIPGVPLEATYPVPNSQIASSLGRNLAACGAAAVCTATANVPLYPTWTRFEPRRTQLDLRLTKVVRLGPTTRLFANLDLYNVTNDSSVLGANPTYGSRWLQPAANAPGGSQAASVMPGRLLHVGGRLTF